MSHQSRALPFVRPYPEDRLARFAQVLAGRGLASALGVLNDGVGHRFTGLYLLECNMLDAAHLYDKAGLPTAGFITRVPLPDSFCRHAVEHGSFSTVNSQRDARLEHSPYQGVVISYLSVAVRDEAGRVRGTLCHFDLITHPCPDEELGLLEQASALIVRGGHLPPLQG